MNQHLTSEQVSRWMVGERTPEEVRHARGCLHCRAELDRLEKALSLFRESGQRWSEHWYRSASQNGSEHVQLGAGQRSMNWVKLSLGAALAASLFVGALLIHRTALVSQPAAPPHSASAEPFVQIPYVAPPAPYERIEVMRMDVPVTALIAAGFEVHVPDSGAAVSADVLVGQDRRVLAIRLVSRSIPNSDRRLDR
ncbi:MAG: hypothetical protein DMG59_01800 [Acidobacteria bacterium]|nr:MAG: hypothetical protein DMG59_01800 [Acidobacteriota bacterium]